LCCRQREHDIQLWSIFDGIEAVYIWRDTGDVGECDNWSSNIYIWRNDGKCDS
jgi:hypothetical protein